METTLSTEQVYQNKLEYNRVHLRKHREKMKSLYGTTYTGSQKESVLKYNKKVKELSGKFPSPFNPFRIKNIENKENIEELVRDEKK